MMEAVYKMHLDGGRMGDLTGLFIATKEDMEKMESENPTVNFGEALGKHSEVVVQWDEMDFKMVSDDHVVVAIIRDNDLETGYNPFDYLSEYYDEDDDDYLWDEDEY